MRCETCGVKKIAAPWARPDSGFTLLFEAMVMTMVSAMPVKAVARMVGEHDTRLWRVVHHYVDQARARADAASVTRVAIDETAARRGHDYISLFVDIDRGPGAVRRRRQDASTVAAFAEDLAAHGGEPEAISEVCIDMSPAFIKGVADNLPKAAVTFDKFHAVKIINEAVDQVVGDPLDEGRAHVDANFADGFRLAAMGREVLDERGDRAGVAAFGGEQHTGLIDIDEQRDIVVTAPRGGFVDGDPRDAGGVGARPRLIHVLMDHAPQLSVVLADDPGDGLDRHRRHNGHHHGLKQQGEAAVGSRPRRGDLLDPALLAAHARHKGLQIGLVLEKVQVSPFHLLAVVGRAVRRAAGRAGETAARREVDIDIQATRLGVETGAHHGPWRRQAERLLHQGRIVQACVLRVLSIGPS